MPAIDDRLSDGPGNPDDNALRGSAVAEAGTARFDSGSSVVAEPKMPGLDPRLVFIFLALPILKPVMPDLPPGLSEIFVPAAAALGDESSPGGGGGGGSGGGGGMGGNGGGMAGTAPRRQGGSSAIQARDGWKDGTNQDRVPVSAYHPFFRTAEGETRCKLTKPPLTSAP